MYPILTPYTPLSKQILNHTYYQKFSDVYYLSQLSTQMAFFKASLFSILQTFIQENFLLLCPIF
jgi:hypothetical protein